jgi:hypothetical protein
MTGGRVAVVSQVPPPVHGQTVMTLRFLDTLERLGRPSRLIDRRFSATVTEVGVPSLRKVIAAVGLLARVVWTNIRFRPEVVVMFVTTRPGSFLVDWSVSELLRRFRRPVVLYVHSVGFEDLRGRGRLWAWCVDRLLDSSGGIVTLGPSLLRDLPGRAAWCIPNTPGPVPSVTTTADACSVLFLSNLIPGKGAEDFARIAGSLLRREETEHWQFTLAGSPADAAVVAAVEHELVAADTPGRVAVVGALGAAEKWQALARSTCLAFTSSLEEAQPLTIVEAFASGTPVIAYRVGGVPDLVEHGVNGLLVDAGDEAAFADAVDSVIRQPALRERLSAGASRTFSARLSERAYTDAWRHVLDERTR